MHSTNWWAVGREVAAPLALALERVSLPHRIDRSGSRNARRIQCARRIAGRSRSAAAWAVRQHRAAEPAQRLRDALAQRGRETLRAASTCVRISSRQR
jgi:hypothetical protein